MEDGTDTGYAAERWEFDGEVTRVFEDMLERSIPQYQTMRDATTRVASSFLPNAGGVVVDLGCSRGDALAAVKDAAPRAHAFGYEISEPMLDIAGGKLQQYPDWWIFGHDLRKGFPAGFEHTKVDVTLLVLTLMFVPINYRHRLLEGAWKATRPGGGIVLVEKLLGEGRHNDDLFTANYHEVKTRSGYTPDDVERKRLSLEGVQVPLTASWNVQMLEAAGFEHVECYWRWMNFAGFVARRTR